MPEVLIAFKTTGGIIVGIVMFVFLSCNAKKIALVALLKDTAYFAPTYFAMDSSKTVTTLSCNRLLYLLVSIV